MNAQEKARETIEAWARHWMGIYFINATPEIVDHFVGKQRDLIPFVAKALEQAQNEAHAKLQAAEAVVLAARRFFDAQGPTEQDDFLHELHSAVTEWESK